MAYELSELGVAPERIVKETIGKESQSTFGNIARLIELMGKNPSWNSIIILTNEYHIPRTSKIIDLILEEAAKISTSLRSDTVEPLKYIFRDELTDEFFAGLKRIASGEACLHVTPCEHILSSYDDDFSDAYRKISGTPEFAKRVAAERQGVYQLAAGSYSRTI